MTATGRPHRAAFGLIVALGGLVVGSQSDGAGGYTPEEARARMVVPEGFTVQVFASEPQIRQPVAACFDERGRMWVIEYLQYPVPAGLKPVTVDPYLRTEYDRVPEPPPHGPRGADRIKILEDTDGDGTADQVTTFLEGLNLASGLAVGHGGVFVGQAPYLLFYADTDHDDKPDGDPEVLLSGFGLQDAHATVNSLAWGPDGWLYGAQGSTVTARIRGVEFQQGVWRYHPRTRRFELFAEGGGNTWGLDFDRGGQAFGSSNGSFVAFHMVQGGYYWKGFAKHGPLHNPNTFGYFDAVAYHGPKLGGHVTPGGIIYKGDAFPEELQGAFIGGNLLANAVYWHRLERRGSTFAARHGGTLIEARDPWFRPIDLLTGPDGAVYVVDWYDRRASHLDPRDNWDKTNGRIYKVVSPGGRPVEPFDLAQKTSEELVALRTEANDWWPEMARRLLAERRDPRVIPTLRTLLQTDHEEALALRDLWALAVSGGLDDPTALGLLDHRVPGVRRWTVRLLGDEHRMSAAIRAKLLGLAATEPDVTVRSQLASSCQRWGPRDALPIVGRLLRRSEDAADPHVPLLLWWALERQMRADREGVVSLLTTSEAQASPLVRDHIWERAARALASGASGADFKACAQLLAAVQGNEVDVDRIVAGMEKGLEGRRLAAVPSALEAPLQGLGDRPAPGVGRIRLAIRLGSAPAYEKALRRVADGTAPEADRLALIEVIGQVGGPEALATLLGLIRRDESPAVHLAVLNALGAFAGSEVAAALLERYPRLDGAPRARILDLLCSRREWAGQLLGAIQDGSILPKDLRPAHLVQIAQHRDAGLTRRLERLWGRVPGAHSPEKIRRIAEVRGILPEGDKGSAARGQAVFQETCAACHKLFGEGSAIGPDLTGVERNLDFLLESLVDPSALIRKEYQAQTVALTDGRVLTGLIVEETGRTITLFDAQQQTTVIPRDEVEESKPSETSLMPEGVLDTLRDDQIRDLFRYLQSSRPPAQ